MGRPRTTKPFGPTPNDTSPILRPSTSSPVSVTGVAEPWVHVVVAWLRTELIRTVPLATSTPSLRLWAAATTVLPEAATRVVASPPDVIVPSEPGRKRARPEAPARGAVA